MNIIKSDLIKRERGNSQFSVVMTDFVKGDLSGLKNLIILLRTAMTLTERR